MTPSQAPGAEGDLPSGHHWRLTCTGGPEDCYTFLETVHPTGRKDKGGMGGPALYPGSDLNVYIGSSDDGFLRVIIRASARARTARVRLGSGEVIELAPALRHPGMGIVVFAALLPRTVELVEYLVLDETGNVPA